MASKEIPDFAGREVPISNPDTVLSPKTGHTKLDLVRYFLAVADIARRSGTLPTTAARLKESAG